MKCVACHAMMDQKRGQIELRIHGKLFLVENVLYEECPSCGERVLSPEISQDIFDKIVKKDYEEKQIIVPVVEGSTEAV